MKSLPQACLAAAFCAIALLPTGASANTESIISSNSSVWAAVGGTFLNYKEAVSPIPDSEHGWLPSIALGAQYMTNGKWFFSLDGSIAPGTVDYNGAVYDSDNNEYPYKDTSQSTIATIDFKVGHGFSPSSSVMLTPYLDIGFNYWKRDLGNSQVEDYHHIESLLGAMVQYSPINRLVLTGYASGGMTFGSGMESDDQTFKLGRAGMYKLGAKVGFNLTKSLEIFSALDFAHFRYAHSEWKYNAEAAGYVSEPGSFTNYTTARVGLAYHLK